jgi:phospholipid/cholesterol/gamma-HCH transport system substrate-binding protein
MKNEVKVGITIIVAIIVAIVGYRFMADIPVFSSTYELYSEFDRVDGIIPGSSVYLQGVKIGAVSSITFQQNDSIRVVYSLRIPNKITTGSTAYIRSIGLLEKGVEIERSRATTFLESGSRIRGFYDGGLMGRLEELGDEVAPNITGSAESLNSLLKQVDGLLAEGGRADIESSLSGLTRTIAQIEQLLKSKNDEIEETITHLRNTMRNVDGLTSGQEARVDSLMMNLESASKKLDNLTTEMSEATATLNNVLVKIDEGQGSLGLLINDPALYNNLDSLTYNLSKLVKDLNENPRHFLKHVRLIDIF